LERLRSHHSIDVMHVEKNVCENLLGTLLNTDEKTRDYGHAQADLKKMRIRSELWLNDSIKGIKSSGGYIMNFCFFSMQFVKKY
jgi:hypothetical protein